MSWIQDIQVGDVLLERGTTPRVVRHVQKSKKGRKVIVTFVIKRRSWTGRIYTVVTTVDLVTRGFVHSGRRLVLDTEMDRQILRHIQNRKLRELTPEDVMGMI